MPDVEMKPDEKKSEVKKDDKEEEKKETPIPIPPETEIKNNAVLIDRTVSTLEPRFTYRVLRTLTALRKRINAAVLQTAIESIYIKGIR